ncbi:YraN family protein [Chitinophaga sp.]|uniref:YraN family protein n=1 Tax=Chitinophaga sp. TaxID=1869181 RepID=UPI0031D5AE4E
MLTYPDLGKKGEEIARAHFLAQDYVILHANWKLGRKEIDLIVHKDGCLVFVEVKARGTDLYGYPEEKVNVQKIRHIRTVAEGYMNRMTQLPKRIRFDIVAITFRKDGSYELVHFEDCF